MVGLGNLPMESWTCHPRASEVELGTDSTGLQGSSDSMAKCKDRISIAALRVQRPE
jgi:hypothetical protein